MISPSVKSIRLALMLLGALALTASPAAATKYAGSFMMDGGGARALGMGSAFVAVADDATATFWNPAGLVGQESRQLIVMHSERFGDILDRDFVSYVHPFDKGRGQTLGLTIIRSGIDDIPFTAHLDEVLDTNNDGTVDDLEAAQIFTYRDDIRYESDQQWAFMGTYAQQMGGWQVGGNVKIIRQSIGDFTSFGVGVDLGVLRRDWWRRLDVGVKFQDATSTYLSWSTGTNETIAPVVVPGVAYDWRFESLHLDVLAAGALETHFDNRNGEIPEDRAALAGDIDGVDQFGWGGLGMNSVSSNLYLGLEARLRGKVDLRIGSHGGFDSEDWTFGAGLDLTRLRVDYAFAGDALQFDDNSHFTHRVSLGVSF